MINQNEINALTELLNRTPLTMSERLFVGMLLDKLVAMTETAKAEMTDQED